MKKNHSSINLKQRRFSRVGALNLRFSIINDSNYETQSKGTQQNKNKSNKLYFQREPICAIKSNHAVLFYSRLATNPVQNGGENDNKYIHSMIEVMSLLNIYI